jgi:lactoylglutathione lyase
MSVTFSHVGVCVSDLERSVRFYEGLGFEVARSHQVGDEFGLLMELEGVRLESRFLQREGALIELLYFESPPHTGAGARRPMNQLGLTHLSVRVDDVDAVAAVVEARGGSVVSGTRTILGDGETSLDLVYCTDPDGVRIELMKLPGSPR